MKDMKIRRVFLSLLFAMGCFWTEASAQESGLEDLTFAQMLKSVDLSKEQKAADLIKKFLDLEGRQ